MIAGARRTAISTTKAPSAAPANSGQESAAERLSRAGATAAAGSSSNRPPVASVTCASSARLTVRSRSSGEYGTTNPAVRMRVRPDASRAVTARAYAPGTPSWTRASYRPDAVWTSGICACTGPPTLACTSSPSRGVPSAVTASAVTVAASPWVLTVTCRSSVSLRLAHRTRRDQKRAASVHGMHGAAHRVGADGDRRGGDLVRGHAPEERLEIPRIGLAIGEHDHLAHLRRRVPQVLIGQADRGIHVGAAPGLDARHLLDHAVPMASLRGRRQPAGLLIERDDAEEIVFTEQIDDRLRRLLAKFHLGDLRA